MSDTPARAVVVKEAPGWPTELVIYGAAGEVTRVEVTGREARLAADLLAAHLMGERK